MPIFLGIIGVIFALYGICIMLVWSGTSFFLIWFALAAIFLVAAWGVHAGAWEDSPMAPKRFINGIVIAVLAIIIVANGFIFTQWNSTGEDDLDAIIVLGAQVRNDGPSVVLQNRLDTAYDYLAANPRTRCIVTGSQGPTEPTTEAEGMAAYLIARGIAPERIVLEPNATDTVENITYSMAFLDSQADRVGIVTNNFHVFRSIHIARRCGLANVYGIAAPSNPLYLPNNLLRESMSLTKDFVLGHLA